MLYARSEGFVALTEHFQPCRLRPVPTLWLLVLGLASNSLYADGLDCRALDPRTSVSKEGEASANVAASTLLKIGKAEGTVEGKVKEVVNSYVGTNATEFDRVLYLFCGMIGTASDIPSSKKFEMYMQLLQAQKENDSEKHNPSKNSEPPAPIVETKPVSPPEVGPNAAVNPEGAGAKHHLTNPEGAGPKPHSVSSKEQNSYAPIASPRELKVGLISYGITADDWKRIDDQLRQIGYQQQGYGYPYTTLETWFAPRSTVLYYRDSSRQAAERLAAQMKDITGESFAVQRGGGFAVGKGEEAITFFVHIMHK
jgi:hypothetical protein